MHNLMSSPQKKSFFSLFLVLFGIIVFYTDLCNWVFATGMLSITPLTLIILLIALSSFIFFKKGIASEVLTSPFMLWLFLYLFITLAWSCSTIASEQMGQIIRNRILDVIKFTIFYLIFTSNDNNIKYGRMGLILAFIIASFNNIYEFFTPFSFASPESELNFPGRSAGFYLNPNESGAAIILALIFTIGLFKGKYKHLQVPYLFIGFIAVLLTISRAAIMAYIVMTIIFILQNQIRPRSFGISFVGLAFLLACSLPAIQSYVDHQTSFDLNNIQTRIDWFRNPEGVKDDSEMERLAVAQHAWKIFGEKPLLGNGIGSTNTWNEPVSTHNMYLWFMADFGFIGIFMLPLLVTSVGWRARGEAKLMVLPACIFTLFWGFFSHNILSNFFFSIALALTAAMTMQSRRKYPLPTEQTNLIKLNQF